MSSKPTALFFTDGSDIGLQCARILAQHPVRVITSVFSTDTPLYGDEIQNILFHNSQPYCGSDSERFIAHIIDSVDFLFSCWYDRRITPEILEKVRRAAVNLHPAYLPFNRGRHSAFWGIYTDSPLGATIHHMTEQFDDGDIIAQAIVEDDGIIPASEVYARQNAACVQLFRDYLPRILDGTAPRTPQGRGEYHHARDIASATQFDAKDCVPMGQVVRLARATSNGEHGFYVRLPDGRNVKVQARVSLA